MSIVTLTTDFGNKDYSVAAVKGAILSTFKNPKIIDISHQIEPYNVTQAAYVLKNAYKNFPRGSIHIVGVESERTPENGHIAMYFDGHYFIGADNGIFTMIMGEIKADKIVIININNQNAISFPVLDTFIKVAAHLSRNGSLEVIGKATNEIRELVELKPVVNAKVDQIVGSVIYVDNYGNVITNITRKLFNEVGKSRKYTIFARNVKFKKVYETYSDAIDFTIPKEKREEDGKKIALFNDAEHLELAIYKSNPLSVGSAYNLFGLEYRDSVTVKFN
ncbi:MAG: SAM-dependent chlorinase/fluorinase [Bacteroidota bacterium]|nr:SAM-dependent chlorinase/fluorinase [Bacteroidota bacterium]